MTELKKTVTVQVKVDGRIADLVYFARAMGKKYGKDLASEDDVSNEDLVEDAEAFWDRQHGEDD